MAGATEGGGVKLKNRPSRHETVSSKQFWSIVFTQVLVNRTTTTTILRIRLRALRELNALRALPVYHFF